MNQDTFMESISFTSDDFLLLGDESAWLGNLPEVFETNLTVSIPEIGAIDSVDMISPTAVETPTLHRALLKTQTTPRGAKQPRKTSLKVSGATARGPRKRTPEQRERERVKKQAKEAKARGQFDEWLDLESKFQHYLKSRVHRFVRGESEESSGEFEPAVLVQMLYSSVNAADRALDFPGQRQLRGRINSRLTTSQLLLPFLELDLEL
ncbi:hypothetical protein Poli38472_002745 [Pythium oligandrum]|uniref:Uncharacterized protein n=1 Tax=Pythium oligandrum TaxID=41045 RepID=A0A8K1CHR2_PYTOL|nr:hypothetical protein Poli38472_002745 [Pythium oligandrum]|eukprot:TMW63804.1 hypothetical protein Poli38472_002745 [Pythium oligandrum]